MSWFKRKQPLMGQVLFRANLPPRAEEFAYLRELGVEVRPGKASADERWTLELRHREWGKGTLFCPRETISLPRAAIEFDVRLTEEEREQLPHAQSSVMFRHEPPTGHLLRDRKHLLRFMNAICGTDGVAAVDCLSMVIWTAAALQDELSHDADLDVQNIFTIHAIHDGSGADDEEPKAHWAHSHGLREVGLFDFNLLHPSEDALGNRTDFTRAMAFMILEGDLKLDDGGERVVLTERPVRFVSARKFLDQCKDPLAEAYRQAVDDFHVENHGVACEAAEAGFIGRMLGRGGVRPLKYAMQEFPDGLLIRFSTAAGMLMAERAKNTLGIFRQWKEEFAEFEAKCIVKLGYETDGGSMDKEFPWFEVHTAGENGIDATLINEPHAISSMKIGDRRMHPLEHVADWMILLPFGQLNPRLMSLARTIRTNRAKLLEVMKELKQAAQSPD